MNYRVLARKWRPQSFQEMTGQLHVAQTLENAVRSKKTAHAYLFSGMRGVGKTSVARILAKTLNCENLQDASPCQTCVSCREVTAGSFVDVLEIDGASNTGVDNVRELQENARYAPLRGKYKIYIIDEVHMLSKSAFNALLKTLEEPPPSVLFILATTEPNKIPATILCRCQHFHFHRLRYSEVMDRLRYILKEEGIVFPERALSRVAKASEGGLRDALTLVDQILSYAGNTPREEEVLAILGSADHWMDPFLRHLFDRQGAELFRVIQTLSDDGFDLKTFCGHLVENLRHLALLKVCGTGEGLLDLPEEEVALLKTYAEAIEIDEIQRLYSLFVRALEEIRWAPIPRYSLEMAVVRAIQMQPLQSVSHLLQRLNDMESKVSDGGFAVLPTKSPVRQTSPSKPAETVVQGQSPDVSDATKALPSPTTRPDAESPAQDVSGLWRDVVHRVSLKKPSLGTCLENARCRQTADDKLTVELFGGRFCFDLTQNRENIQLISEISTTVFSQRMTVFFEAGTVSPGITTAGPVLTKAVPRAHSPAVAGPVGEGLPPEAGEFEDDQHETVKKEVQEAFGGDPIVGEAIRIFGGKVMAIHPKETR